jgi:glycerol-3-phosphate dehydrogenase
LSAGTIDLLVVGGGINGVGIALDAAGRGLSVLLCERGDLAGATSSASSKLVHGGLRYLEHFEFRLVRESLAEREVLMRAAPHLVAPLRFNLPLGRSTRPAWMVRLGLLLYDHLARRDLLPPSRRVRFDPAGPLLAQWRHGFAYSDCSVDDARLVVLAARAAADRGAEIRTGEECVALAAGPDGWRAELRPAAGGPARTVAARAVVNAAGPWVSSFLQRVEGVTPRHAIRLVKGSHIVVPALTAGDEAYILQNDDGRVVFVLPGPAGLSLVGTTDVEITGDPAAAAADPAEVAYLVAVVNRYFRRPLTPADVLHSFAGVRPLLDDGRRNASAVTRDYTLELDRVQGGTLLSVFGGKLTTFRRLAESAVDRLRPVFPAMGPAWTGHLVLPGGDFASRADLEADFARRWPWLPEATRRRWVRAYGTLAAEVAGDAAALADLGEVFGAGLTAREVEYLVTREWARTAEDVLWRRTKLGLAMTGEQRRHLGDWLAGGARRAV